MITSGPCTKPPADQASLAQATMNVMTLPEINVDRLMLRIREEVAQRTRQSATSSAGEIPLRTVGPDLEALQASLRKLVPDVIPAPRADVSLSEPDRTSSLPRFSRNSEAVYRLTDFLLYEGAAFVTAAYQAILNREPDEDGLKCYLTMLRDGASKAEILGRICASPEGKQQRVRVDGLRLTYLLDRISRWPIVGRVIGIALAVWNLPATERRHRRLSGDLAYQLAHSEQNLAVVTKDIHKALRTLVQAQNLLSALSTTFASRTHLDVIQRALSETIAALHTTQAGSRSKVDTELFEGQLGELRAQIDKKADHAELIAANRRIQTELIEGQLGELRAQIDKKTDHAELVAANRRIQTELVEGQLGELRAQIDKKADHAELIAANRRIQSVSVNALEALEAKSMEVAEVRTAMTTLAQNQAAMQESKADLIDLTGLHHSVLRAIETKPERHELTALAGHLVTLVEQRAAMDDLKPLTLAISQAADAIDSLRRDKADARDIDRLHAEFQRKSRMALDGANWAIQGLARTKADESALVALREELRAALRPAAEAGNAIEQVATASTDRAVIQELHAELSGAIARSQKVTMEALDGALGDVKRRAQDLGRQVLDQDRRIGLLLEEARKRFPKPISTKQIAAMLSEDNHRFDGMYASFADQVRGTRSDIRQRQTIYVPYVRRANAGTAKAPVIDIGCGRGEWLELMRDEGLIAKGIDLNRVFLQECRERDLDVAEEDAVSFLCQLKNNSAGVVTSFHMIEHLEHKALIAFLDETFRVLRPGGAVILETPNPRNVVVGSCNFYLDPTHQRPLPPTLSRCLLEARGFNKVEVREIHPYGPEHYLTEGAHAVKEALNQLLYSSQDYAVIGWKA